MSSIIVTGLLRVGAWTRLSGECAFPASPGIPPSCVESPRGTVVDVTEPFRPIVRGRRGVSRRGRGG